VQVPRQLLVLVEGLKQAGREAMAEQSYQVLQKLQRCAELAARMYTQRDARSEAYGSLRYPSSRLPVNRMTEGVSSI
jgi:hypothetical protein